MPDFKFYRSPNGWYTMVVPGHWEHLVVEGIPAFFDPDEAGALQVYAFERKSGSYDLDQELESYLGTHSIAYDPEKVATFENSEGALIKACEFMKENRFWLVYMVSKGDKMILITYNADNLPDEKLSNQLTTVISSFRFL